MKLNCGPTYEEKVVARKRWHPFFALWPRRVGSGDCRWLETIERKGRFIESGFHSCWLWDYRAKEKTC